MADEGVTEYRVDVWQSCVMRDVGVTECSLTILSPLVDLWVRQ
jgi:hypothetical protein